MRFQPSHLIARSLQALFGMLTVTASAHAGGGSGIVEYERNATLWKNESRCYEAYAFDQYFPGVAGDTGCLVSSPGDPVVMNLASGTVTISALQGTTPICAIQDGSTTPMVADAVIANNLSKVVFEFDPPVVAFYTYYGSMASGKVGTMKLYQDNVLIDTFVSAPSPSNVAATGHGFAGSIPIDRIEISCNDTGSTLVGAFTGLATGEPSLGTLSLAQYTGPAGNTVQMDFGCVFQSTSRVHNITQDIWHWCIRDAIAWAVNGDVIVANPSMYHEAIDFQGKAITLMSADPNDPEVVASTILDALVFQTSAVRCGTGEGSNTVLNGLTIRSGNAMNGGGMFIGAGASPTVTGCTFADNLAQFGGGIYENPGSNPTVVNCTFRNNTAQTRGGAIYMNQVSTPLSNCDFTANRSTFGGGVYVVTANPNIQDCQFTDNVANTRGGALFFEGGTPTISDCQFERNSAVNQGGAISGFPGGGGLVTINDCQFTDNVAGGDGGGVWGDTTRYTIERCDFEGNQSARGAAAFLSGATGPANFVHDSRFYRNAAHAVGAGGGGSGVLYVKSNNDQPTLALVKQCVFNTNQSVGLVADGGSVTVNVESCTFTGNALGALVSNNSALVILLNCIMWGDALPEVITSLEGNVLWTYCNMQGTGGAGGQQANRDVDPMFVDALGRDGLPGTADDDLRLSAGSPCIDVGQGTYNPASPQFDFDGTPRHQGVIDLGAYEFAIDCDDSGTPDYIEIANGQLADCNHNLHADNCESIIDCNLNGIIDECDIANGILHDTNSNGFPDEYEVSSIITGIVNWNTTNRPIVLVTQDLSVAGSLTIDAGVKLMIADGRKITVINGAQFIVNGSAANPVRFTSVHVHPAAGDWNGIRFTAGSAGSLSHAIIEYTRNHGVRIENAPISVQDCIIRHVAGIDQPDGTATDPALPGGTAYGIFVSGSVSPTFARNTIEHVRGGRGGAGARGVAGDSGNFGTIGATSGANGTDGQDASSPGTPGAVGAAGGDADGIHCESAAQPTIRDNIVRLIVGGAGGNGGSGGWGGEGGEGGWGMHGDPTPDFLQFWVFQGNPPGISLNGGDGGNGGNGTAGGIGANGGPGGIASAIRLDSVANAQVNQNLIAELSGGAGGAGGEGGRGGSGGKGGWGGFGMSITIPGTEITLDGSAGEGGDGGNGGNAANGGAGGSGGESRGIYFKTQSAVVLFSAQNTLAQLHNGPGGAAGEAGAPGTAGDPGLGGNNHVLQLATDNCPNGFDQCAYLQSVVIVANMGAAGTEGSPAVNGGPGSPGPVRALMSDGETLLAVTNTVLHSADPTQSIGVMSLGNSSLTVDYTLLSGFETPFGPGTSNQGLGNLLVDPNFINPAGGDFHLAVGSPAIDTGSNSHVPGGFTTDLEGSSRIVDGNGNGTAIVDMGCYEGQPNVVTCLGDIAPTGGDGVVNSADLLLIINSWGACAGCPADIAPAGGNGVVNSGDLLAVINAWGPCP